MKDSEPEFQPEKIFLNSSLVDVNNSKIPCEQSIDSSYHMSTSSKVTGEDCTTNSETSPLAEGVDIDVVMQDTTSSSGTQNNKNFPEWITQMIVYLRRVSDAPAWHDLVSGFIEFENCGPPSGVSSCWMLMGTD